MLQISTVRRYSTRFYQKRNQKNTHSECPSMEEFIQLLHFYLKEMRQYGPFQNVFPTFSTAISFIIAERSEKVVG